jgi:hypothetical protein
MNCRDCPLSRNGSTCLDPEPICPTVTKEDKKEKEKGQNENNNRLRCRS